MLSHHRCCCCASSKKPFKPSSADALSSSAAMVRPTIVHSSQQPPPYTSFGGVENKAKEISDDDKVAFGGAYLGTTVKEQPNSNTNSANGGSVNSQVCYWEVCSILTQYCISSSLPTPCDGSLLQRTALKYCMWMSSL